MTYRLHAACSTAVLVLGIWLSSGTLAPYAATIPIPHILEPCHYLANVDHDHFVSAYRMLNGDPREAWQWSLVLRRVLFPLIAFPLMKFAGFLAGGFIASILIHIAAVNAFGVFVRRLLGDQPSVVALWLLATYPGIAYWAALPYSYVIIVPGSLLSLMLLYKLRSATTTRGCLTASILLGVIFTGYDLHPYFAPPAMAMLALQRRFRHAVLSVAAMLAPTLAVALAFQMAKLSFQNANSDYYFMIIGAWIRPDDFTLWGGYLRELPATLVSNLFFSNFVVLPVLGIVAGIVARRDIRWSSPESLLLLTALLLFLFNNAAPPYVGWQLRGTWVARLYQPIFVTFVMYAARATAELRDSRTWKLAVTLAVVMNGAIVAGPVTLNSTATLLYHKFYAHSHPRAFLDNLKHFGRRPLGFCEQRHLEEGWTPYTHRTRIPKWMFR